MGGMKDRSSEAQKVLRELDAELAAASQSAGTTLVWTAADHELLSLIADSIDRHTDRAALYDKADDVKSRVRLSAEMRLFEGSLARLLKQVHTAIPAPESQTTIKARRAARARWDRRDATGRTTPGRPARAGGLQTDQGSRACSRPVARPRLCTINDPVERERMAATAPKYSLTVLYRVDALLANQPVRVPRWLLGGHVRCPEAVAWPEYTSRRHQWFTIDVNDVVRPAC